MSIAFDFRGLTPENWLCVDCGMNTAPGALSRVDMENAARALGERWKTNEAGIPWSIGFDAEVYTVRATVWKKAGIGPMGGCLCVGCLEKRIGRRLKPKDFPPDDAFYGVAGTPRLMNRQGMKRSAVKPLSMSLTVSDARAARPHAEPLSFEEAMERFEEVESAMRVIGDAIAQEPARG